MHKTACVDIRKKKVLYTKVEYQCTIKFIKKSFSWSMTKKKEDNYSHTT